MASAQPNLEKSTDLSTGFDCALCDEPNTADSDMIRCDGCKKWHHFECVGITEWNEDDPWFCATCEETEKPAGPEDKNVGEDAVNQINPPAQDLPPNVDGPKETLGNPQMTEQEYKAHLERMREIQRQSFIQKLQREKAMREMQLQLERELLQMQREADAEFQQKRSQLLEEFGHSSLEQKGGAVGGQIPEQNSANAENVQGTNKKYPLCSTPNGADPPGFVEDSLQQTCNGGNGTTPTPVPSTSGMGTNPSGNSAVPPISHPSNPLLLSALRDLLKIPVVPPAGPNPPADPQAVPPAAPPVIPQPVPPAGQTIPPADPQLVPPAAPPADPQAVPPAAPPVIPQPSPPAGPSLPPADPQSVPPAGPPADPQSTLPSIHPQPVVVPSVPAVLPTAPGIQGELTRAQIAARKGPFAKLPTFTGKPEEWPIFYSSYLNGNTACNWSNLENLGRLQEAIRGKALEVVRSSLLLPELVPTVIEELKDQFGKPEHLLHALLQKAKKVESPRFGNAQSFNDYGLVVKQLRDHLVAVGLVHHLTNPFMIAELANKLPHQTQTEWVRYSRGKESSLTVFSKFVATVVAEVNEAALIASLADTSVVPKQKENQKKTKPKEQGFLNAHVGIEPASTPSKGHQRSHESSSRIPCRSCNRTDHRLRYCDNFQKLQYSERMKIVDKWKLCKMCLNDHGDSRCRFKGCCGIGDCKERHSNLLHPPASTAGQVSNPTTSTVTTNCNAHDVELDCPVIFRVVPITIYNGGRSMEVIAFLDEGSSYSLMDNKVAEALNMTGVWRPILVKWTAGMSRLERDSRRLNVTISAKGSEEKMLLRNVHTVQELQLPEQKLRFAEIAARYKHLSDLPIDDDQSGPPMILIGLKHLHVYAPMESRIGQPGEPIGVRTLLGWTIYGPQNDDDDDAWVSFVGTHDVKGLSDQDLHELLRNFYTLEESSVSVTELVESNDDRRARELLEQNTIRVGDRFETCLLWKEDHPQLPDSLPMALRRLKGLERKLDKNPELQQNVEKQIEDYQRKGYAHIATPEELAEAEPGKEWYSPLNVVVNPKKPGKIRLVWDAAASVRGRSLNSALLKGPDLLVSLPAVMSKFRERPIAFGGDIAEMYHQLNIRRCDKCAQRFIYRPSYSKEPLVFVMDVAMFGATCSPCSAQYVKNRNAQQFVDQYPDAVKAIIENHYVDDYFDSTSTVSEAIQRASDVAFIHSKAGFNIRNWVSNSPEFMQHFSDTGDRVVHFNCDKINGTERVLGMAWDTDKDVFTFAHNLQDDIKAYMSGELLPTKRILLSIVMRFYDPFGLWALYIVHGKLIIQALWRKGCQWDDTLDDESAQLWMRWIQLLPQVQGMKVPRCYFSDAQPSDYNEIQLHIFSDASEAAYGCVAYLRATVNGEPRCALVTAKSKVAPLQYVSVPRLELMGVDLAVNVSVAVKANHSLPIKRVVIWTDSCTVLSWIYSDHWKYKPFVANRLGNIRSNTTPGDCRYVPTKYNVADVVTKWGTNGPPLEPDGIWINGPDFLRLPEEQWPQRKQPSSTTEELRAHYLFHEISFLGPLVDVTRFSRWTRLVRTIAFAYRFISNCRMKKKGLPIQTVKASPGQMKLLKVVVPSINVPLVSEEYQKAENYLWRTAQQEGFPDEVKTLLKNKEGDQSKRHSIDKCSPLYKLCPFLDGAGVIRAEGRTAYVDFLPFEQRLSVVLPKEHAITHLLIQHYHARFGHANAETVFHELRQRFEIKNLRAVIKKMAKDCMHCRVKKCRPVAPRMAPLPQQRLKPHIRPFSYVGIDYFGPVIVTVGRRSEKRWICLFTCLVTRAIHLEVVHSLSGPSCMMAITRFIRRRGQVLEFFSDNGTNFQAASKEIAKQIQSITIDCAEIFTDARTRWNFNPPSAPHMGGAWERLVRSAKEALKGIHDGGKLSDEILVTALAQVEDMVNSRPLTYVSRESNDGEALTPNHFLRGLPAGERQEVNVATDHAAALRDGYKRSLELADLLWRKWIREYIPTINHRTKWIEEREPVEVDELVYVADEANRRTWVRGRVTEVFRNIDGRVRRAKVQLARDKELTRPVAKLAVMELGSKSGQNPGPGPGLREGGCCATGPTVHDSTAMPSG